MKILHAHKFYYPRRGAERYMLDLMQMQERAGHTVAPFSMHYPKNLRTPWSEYFVSELKTQKVGKGLLAVKQAARACWSKEAEQKMDRMLSVFQPDVVHVHNIYTHLSPSILRPAQRRGIPVVMTVHDHGLVCANHSAWDGKRPLSPKEMGPWSAAKTRFAKGSYTASLVLALIHEWHLRTGAYSKRIDRFLPVSNYMKDVMVARGFKKEQIQVVHNFVHPLCKPRNRKTSGVLYVGSLDDYKGVQTAIDAMKQLPSFSLRIAGSGPYEGALRERAKNMKNVEFLGQLNKERLGEAFAKARVAVFPSLLNEPFGLAIAEAMACGVPVVVSNRGGIPEIVEDGVSGRVFKAGDAKVCAQALKTFLVDDTYAHSVGQAATVRAKRIADPAAHLKTIMGIYNEVTDAV